MAKTTVEKIEGIETKIEQLENERKRLMKQQKEAERKARTKRLIERGAILESLISGADTFTNEQIKSVLEKVLQTPLAHNALVNVTAHGAAQLAKPAQSTESAKPPSGAMDADNLLV